jgi:hypothetical protein
MDEGILLRAKMSYLHSSIVYRTYTIGVHVSCDDDV